MVVVDKVIKKEHFIPVKTTYKDANIANIFMKEFFQLHRIPKVLIEILSLLVIFGIHCLKD